MSKYWQHADTSPLETYAHGQFPAPHHHHLHHQAHQQSHLVEEDDSPYPNSVPLPNEEFAPFLSEYTDYDAMLEQSLSIQDLGIGQPLPSTNDASTYIGSEDLTILKPSFINKYAYDSQKMPTSPGLDRNLHTSPLLSSPVPSKPRYLASSPQRPPPIRMTSPLPAAYPLQDIPSSPPTSPVRPGLELTSDPDPLGIQNIHSSSIPYSDRQSLRVPSFDSSPPSSPYANRIKRSPLLTQPSTLDWQPILTIPDESQVKSREIIRNQAIAAAESKSRRKSCLPPGVVDEYVGGPHEGGIYECLYPHCGRLFKRRYNLRSHIQTHLCDRPYTCDVCSATFVRPHDLRRHERCHSASRPFVCPCGKGFTRMDALQRHRYRMICKGALNPSDDKKHMSSQLKREPGQQTPEFTSESESGTPI